MSYRDFRRPLTLGETLGLEDRATAASADLYNPPAWSSAANSRCVETPIPPFLLPGRVSGTGMGVSDVPVAYGMKLIPVFSNCAGNAIMVEELLRCHYPSNS